MKIPYKEVFDLAGDSYVRMGINGIYKVSLVKDSAGRRFLSVRTQNNGLADDETRDRVLETFALSLIEREEEDHRR